MGHNFNFISCWGGGHWPLRPPLSYGLGTLGKTLDAYWSLGSSIIDGIFLVQKLCIYFCVMIITTVLITRGPVQWRGQLVMHHVYIMYINNIMYIHTLLRKHCFLSMFCHVSQCGQTRKHFLRNVSLHES